MANKGSRLSSRKASGNSLGESAPRTQREAARVEEHIGRRLKAMFDHVAAEPIPDRLLDLLKRLDEKDADK